MKCPSCNAQVAESASVCDHCGYRFDGGDVKKTMMGLPAMNRQEDEDSADSQSEANPRSTLFGLPAASRGEQGEGLEESTSPAAFAEADDDDPIESGATQMVSGASFDQILEADKFDQSPFEEASEGADEPSERRARSTMFGLPSPDKQKDSGQDDVASAWGLADESSEEEDDSSTQVAGAALAEAIFESQQGGQGFSRSANEPEEETHGTLMGMTREEMEAAEAEGDEATAQVDPNLLRQIRQGRHPAEQTASQGARSGEPEQPEEPVQPDEPLFEEEEATQSMGRDELAKFEERIQSDRRKQLLQKLRSKSSSNDGAADASPSAGPKFSIPKPGHKQAQDEPPEIEVEPLEPVDDTPVPTANSGSSGQTAFPIPSGLEDASQESARRELSDEELELAFEDTGVVSGDEVDQKVGAFGQQNMESGEIREFVEESDAGIRPFTDDMDTGEPVFPAQDNAGGQSFGSTPASQASSNDQSAARQTPQQSLQPQQAGFQNQGSAAQAPPEPQSSAQQQPESQDSTLRLVATVQKIFGVLAAAFLIGGGAYGAFGAAAGADTTALALGAAPGVLGLLALVISFLPLRGGLRVGGLFLVAALSLAVLVGGIYLTMTVPVMLATLGGILLLLCAGLFPVVLKLVK